MTEGRTLKDVQNKLDAALTEADRQKGMMDTLDARVPPLLQEGPHRR